MPLPSQDKTKIIQSSSGHNLSDEDLMLQLSEGGKEAARAMENLMNHWKYPLLSFFSRSLNSWQDAEDLTIEVFVRLQGSASRYRPEARFSTYLFQIARRLLLNFLRSRKRQRSDQVESLFPEHVSELADQRESTGARTRELHELLDLALQRIPEKYRTPLLLLKQQDLDPSEIARVLGIKPNGLRVILHRGRQLLKTEMENLS